MKRTTFKNGYIILHFAVAVSIVLIGIRVLIGFGETSVKTIGKGIDKIEQSYENYKWKENEPKRIAESIERQKINSEKGRKNLIEFIPRGCKFSAWQIGDLVDMKKVRYQIYEKRYIDYCMSVAYGLIKEEPTGKMQMFSQINDHNHFNSYVNWFNFNKTLIEFRKENKPDYLKELLQ